MLSSTANEIVNELGMIRDAFESHSLLLLEGNTDRAFWYDYTPTCRHVVTGSKDTSLQVLQIVEEEGELDGVVAIIDPDYWLLEDSDELNANDVLFDDTPDLEVMLLFSPALEKFLRHEMTGKDPEAISTFSKSLLDHSFSFGSQCGVFRLLDHRFREYNLSLGPVQDSLTDFLNCESLQFNRRALARMLVVNSRRISDEELLSLADSAIEEISVEQNLCRGKDVLCIIVHIFPRLFRDAFSDEDLLSHLLSKASANDASRCYMSLFREIRKSYERHFLKETKIIERIRSWERTNCPFKILAEDI